MFHENLKRYMRIKEKTARDFISNQNPLLRIPKSTFYDILAGRNTPSPENANKIAQVLGIKSETLFKKDDKNLNQIHSLKNIKKAKQTTVEEAIKREQGEDEKDREIEFWKSAHNRLNNAYFQYTREYDKKLNDASRLAWHYYLLGFALGIFVGVFGLMTVVALLS